MEAGEHIGGSVDRQAHCHTASQAKQNERGNWLNLVNNLIQELLICRTVPFGAPSWFGDSVGFWEGETLIVKTKNFAEFPPLSGASSALQVTEFFTRQNDGAMHYRFIVEDSTIWTEPWGGEYVWPPSDGKLYEYACHEGNYALGNIMRGARALENEAIAAE